MSLPLSARVAVASLLLLAACAGDPGPEPRSGPPSPGAPPPPAAARVACRPLFVSPAGEPFRAEAESGVCPLRTWFTKADANGDGELSRTEFRNDALRFFSVLDVNGDGVIDALELQRYEHRVAPEILGGGRGDPDLSAALASQPRLWRAALQIGGGGGGLGGGLGGGGGGGYGGGGRGGHGGGDPPDQGAAPKSRLEGGGGLARFGLLAEPEPVAAADLNFDGRITREEFATRADQRFASLDEAEAGRLTYADLERRLAARSREGGRPRGGGGPSSGGRGGRGGHGGGGRGGGVGGPPQD